MRLSKLDPPWWHNTILIACTISLSLAVNLVFADTRITDRAFEQLKKDVQSEMDKRYDEAQTTDEIFPGATFAIMMPDGRIAKFATGYSDEEAGIRMTPDARMPSGSIGKTYVAAVALDMSLDGLLDLDRKISHWLGKEPWFNRLPNGSTITLRHLLNHSSGLIDHVFVEDSGFQEYAKEMLSNENSDSSFAPRDLVQFVLDRDPLFPPGEGYSYTDTGYILVGLIIEEVSPLTYYEELEKRILKSLGLDLTTPQNRRDIPGLAQGYAPTSNELFGAPMKVLEDGVFRFDPSTEWTGGGLINNPGDLVKWGKSLYEGKAIRKPYLDTLLNSVATRDKGQDKNGRTYGYGLGVYISKTELGTTFGHGGFFPGYNSKLSYYPDYSIAVAMQINTDASQIEGHTNAIAEIVINAIKGSKL